MLILKNLTGDVLISSMEKYKEYRDYLFSKGYKHEPAPYQFLDDSLEIVSFESPFGDSLYLYVSATPEFTEYLEGLPEGTEYNIEEGDYEVTGAHFDAKICNVSGFTDGDTSGITLTLEPSDYYQHGMDLFETCVDIQTGGLAKHELKILESHIKLLRYIDEVIKPVLVDRADYTVDYDSIFDFSVERQSSDPVVTLKHINGSEINLYTDCLTGEHKSDLEFDIFGKTKEELWDTMMKELWKKPWYDMENIDFSYLWSGDSRETKDSAREIKTLWRNLAHPDWRQDDINENLIPDRYQNDLKKWKELCKNTESSANPIGVS